MNIKKYDQNFVFENIGKLFNVHNLSKEKPDDYNDKLELCLTKNWIDLFHKDNYYTIKLDGDDLFWMKQAMKSGCITKRFPHMFDEELVEICQKYEKQFIPGNWFIRTDRVSLKYGKHGVGPYTNFRDIIESLVTSCVGHLCFDEKDQSCTLYFMKWVDIKDDKEFRIFVHNNEITAISTQDYFTPNPWLSKMSENETGNVVQKIQKHFAQKIAPKLGFIGSYTMDLALIGKEDTPYFIEPNSFGANYAAGSALFHWVLDNDVLCDHKKIEVRFVE